MKSRSRVAAKECSPRRKPWVRNEASQSPRGGRNAISATSALADETMRVSTIVEIRRLVAALAALLLLTACGPPRADIIVIGSKNFTEQLVLGAIMAQQIANKTYLPFERRFYRASTSICPQALRGRHFAVYT